MSALPRDTVLIDSAMHIVGGTRADQPGSIAMLKSQVTEHPAGATVPACPPSAPATDEETETFLKRRQQTQGADYAQTSTIITLGSTVQGPDPRPVGAVSESTALARVPAAWGNAGDAAASSSSSPPVITVASFDCCPFPLIRLVQEPAHSFSPNSASNLDPAAFLAAVTDIQVQPSPGRCYRVFFMDNSGTGHMHTAIFRMVQDKEFGWAAACGVKFEVVSAADQADIRVTFATKNIFYSIVGPAAMSNLPLSTPTMNLGFAESAVPTAVEYSNNRDGPRCSFFRRKVLHEFGHAIGFVHEQSHPASGIPWDVPKVIQYYRQHTTWSEEEIRNNVMRVLQPAACVAGDYDPFSIMHYRVPAELLTDPSWLPDHRETTYISKVDAKRAADLYGPPHRPYQGVASSAKPKCCIY